jgi:transcriptional/translational regulatory protein YebC/TACO1
MVAHKNAYQLILQLFFSEGGSPDPNLNAQLSSTIAQARKYNMPLASIQNAIKQNKVNANVCGIQGFYIGFMLSCVPAKYKSRYQHFRGT